MWCVQYKHGVMVFISYDPRKMSEKSVEGRKGDATVDSRVDLHSNRYNPGTNSRQLSGIMDSENGSQSFVDWCSSKTRCRRVVASTVGPDASLGQHLVNYANEQRSIVSIDEPQDADYSYIPLLNDELALLILARVPRSEHPKLCCINKRYLSLVKSGKLSKRRRELGVTEALVIMFASGEHHWWELSPSSGFWRMLPDLPCELTFYCGDRESLSVGYHLLISGIESDGMSIWRYEFLTNSWHRGPPMTAQRCLFASANCGDVACVAGGVINKSILSSAEQYDPISRSWEPLPSMRKRRQRCSGCFMDNKFYVIGGMNEDGSLTCGEFYDREKNSWQLVPDMVKTMSNSISQSPPLIAVIDNELYALETTSNQLKVYLKGSTSWKDLGMVPVRTNHNKGWGIAFKSLGDRLLVLGEAWDAGDNHGQGLSIFTCRPDPNARDCQWDFLGRTGNFMGPFVFNCAIMVV